MPEITEREKELLGYIDKLLKFHALFMQTLGGFLQIAYANSVLSTNISESMKKIDPFNTMKNMIETLNVNFGTSYNVVTGGEDKKEEKIQ